MILGSPDWGTTGEHAYWRRLLDRMTMGVSELPNGPIYVPEDLQETMPAPECGSFLYIADASRNPVPVSDLDQVVLKELMALFSWISREDPSTPPSLLQVVSALMSLKLQQSRHLWLMLTTA